jgi:hypothetical protein
LQNLLKITLCFLVFRLIKCTVTTASVVVINDDSVYITSVSIAVVNVIDVPATVVVVVAAIVVDVNFVAAAAEGSHP